MRNLFNGARARAAFAAVVALGAVGGTVATATTASAATTSVTAKPTATYVALFTAVSVKGTANPTSTARTVTLQKYTGGRWVKVVSGYTSRGTYALKVPTSAVSASTYRVYVSAKGSYTARASATFKVAVVRKTTASIGLSKSSVAWNGTSYVKGVLAPGNSGRSVYVQRYNYDTKKWVSIASGKSGYKGAYSVAVKGNEPHGWSQNLRVYIPSATGLSNATSKAVLLKMVSGGVWTSADGCWANNSIGRMPASDAPARCGFGDPSNF